ncbi:MAG: hypothetical protein Q7L55_08285 [Actinomycetota bacterium]|nr:hypothetical protein [Actinomycetota bacterium]
MTVNPKIALATCAAYPELDIDDRHLLEPLRAAGLDPSVTVWNDPAVSWEQYDMVLIRSTWDYTKHRSEFLAWAKSVESVTELANPLAVVTWSSEKGYLRDLEQGGVPIVPTVFVAPGQSWTFPSGEFVVKPTISAGSRDTVRLSSTSAESGNRAVQALHSMNRVAMIQPYFPSVDVSAETAMIFFDGQFSHAVSKAALLILDQPSQLFERELFLRERISRTQARPDQLLVATAALQCAPSGWLYARVDLVDDEHGDPVVLELEMVEPSLFLGFYATGETQPSAKLAKMIANRLVPK